MKSKLMMATFLIALTSCQPLTNFNKTPSPSATKEKKQDWARIPAGPMDTEEILIAQAKDAARRQAERRAAMGRKKKEELAAGQVASPAKEAIPTIDELLLQEQQAKVAARDLLARRAALARREKTEPTAPPVQTEEPVVVAVVTEPNPDLLKAERNRKEAMLDAERKSKEALERELAKEKETVAAKETTPPKEKTSIASTPPKETTSSKSDLLAAAAELKKENEKEQPVKTPIPDEIPTDENARTNGTKDYETERQRAARYARQNLEMHREKEQFEQRSKRRSGLFASRRKNKTEETETPETITPETTTTAASDPYFNIVSDINNVLLDQEPAKETEAVPEPRFRRFYFPVENLESAKAYCYVASEPSTDTLFFLMKSMVFNNKLFFITETYDSRFRLKATSRERINERGVFMEDYTSYEQDGFGDTHKVEYWVEEDEAFRWGMNDEDKVITTFNYNSAMYPNYDITTSRTRYLVSETGNFIFNGRMLPTITTEDQQITIYVNHKQESEEYVSTFMNQYAEGVGLVKFVMNKRDKDVNVARTYLLKEVFSYEEWQMLSRVNK